MENTLENKYKFFAIYWLQKVERWPNDDAYYSVDGVSSKGSYLELKPLSSISDEDVIEVAKLQAPTFDDKSKVFRFEKSIEIHRLNYVLKLTHEISTFHRGILLVVGGAVQNMYAYDSLIYTDFLRSRGYAIPFMGLSVEEQISRGWVRLSS